MTTQPAEWPVSTPEHAAQITALATGRGAWLTPQLAGEERAIPIDPDLTDEQLGQLVRAAITEITAGIGDRCRDTSRVVDRADAASTESPVRVRLIVKTWPAKIDESTEP